MNSKNCTNSFALIKSNQTTSKRITIPPKISFSLCKLITKLTPHLNPLLILLTLLTIITLTTTVGAASTESTAVEDWENSHYNKTGKCESIHSPKSEAECFSQTNETHSCCMVKLNGTYLDPSIIELYPAPAAHRLRMLGGAAAADASHSTEVNHNEFKKCIAVYKTEKAVTSVVRKYKYNGTLLNSYFVCNTTLKVNPCGMAKPGKFEDCKSHSSKKKKCCLVSYLEMQTCELDLGLPHNNSNHLGVKFTCGAHALRFEKILMLFVFLVIGLGGFV